MPMFWRLVSLTLLSQTLGGCIGENYDHKFRDDVVRQWVHNIVQDGQDIASINSKRHELYVLEKALEENKIIRWYAERLRKESLSLWWEFHFDKIDTQWVSVLKDSIYREYFPISRYQSLEEFSHTLLSGIVKLLELRDIQEKHLNWLKWEI